MNPQPANDDPESSSVESGDGVGRRLRAAREAQGLGTERIATLLHLNPSLVESLEQDRYADLPGAVFIAGYIRNYARHVGLDPEPLVAVYRAAEGSEQTDRRWSEGSAARRSGDGFLLVRLVSIVVVVGLSYLFAQWWQGRAPEGPDLTLAGNPTPAVAPQGPAAAREAQARPQPRALGAAPGLTDPVPPAVVPQPVGVPPSGGSVRGADAASAPAPAPGQGPREVAVAPAQPAQGAAPQPDHGVPGASVADAPGAPAAGVAAPDAAQAAARAGDPGVVLEFQGNCWVDIRDAAKTFSLKGEMSKGDRRVLGGTPPYELKLGNAAAVAITVNGVPFDLGRVARTNSPRFKLDPAKLP
jgi:cytoskeleton protein RodZ